MASGIDAFFVEERQRNEAALLVAQAYNNAKDFINKKYPGALDKLFTLGHYQGLAYLMEEPPTTLQEFSDYRCLLQGIAKLSDCFMNLKKSTGNKAAGDFVNVMESQFQCLNFERKLNGKKVIDLAVSDKPRSDSRSSRTSSYGRSSITFFNAGGMASQARVRAASRDKREQEQRRSRGPSLGAGGSEN